MTTQPNTAPPEPSYVASYQYLSAMLLGHQNVTLITVTPLVLYFVCAVHLCKMFARYTYFPRVSRRNRNLMRKILLVISLFNTIILWAVFVTLLKQYLAQLREDVLDEDAPKDDDETLELLIMYSVALVVVSFVYFTELKSHLSAFYQNFSIHRAHSSELGRSAYYLLVPPNAALQNVLTTFDRFYAQRHVYSRLPTLQHRRPINTTSLSETGGARHRSNIRIPKLMGPLPMRPSSTDLDQRPIPLDIVVPQMVVPPRNQTIRRCVSLESMPVFLPDYVG